MHSTDKLNDGYFGSGKRLWFSINYYGKENHVKEILEWLPTREELKKREKEIVNKKLIRENLCMNLCVGGEGGRGFTSNEQKLNAVKSNEKQKQLRETNQEWVNKRKENSSIGHKKVFDEGRQNRNWGKNWTGLTHSEESKKLMSQSSKGMGTGSNNSQYGTQWVTNGTENRKIKKDADIPIGWYKGRK